MTESLDQIKQRIADKYIGKAGIHAVGISRSRNAIRIYLKLGMKKEQKVLLAEIEEAAAPYQVLFVEDKPPRITSK